MKKIIAYGLTFGLLLGSTLAFGASPAEAKRYKKRVNVRQKKQQKRLHHGVKNGSLTKREYKGLQKQQIKLNRAERKMRRSGCGLSKKEARLLEKKQNKMSKNIYKQKHDKQKRN